MTDVGKVKELDKEQRQEIEFSEKTSIKKDIKEVADSYINFCAEMSNFMPKHVQQILLNHHYEVGLKVNLKLGTKTKFL